MEAIDLDQRREESSESPAIATSEPPEGPRYPTFFYDSDKPLDIPDSGTMTIRYKKTATSENKSERDGEARESYSCTIEVQKIVGLEGDSAETPEIDPDAKLTMESILGGMKGTGE